MAAKYLKKNKAPGIDGKSPIAWCSGLIKPTVYNKGDRKILATTEETCSHGQIILIIADRLSLWQTFQCQIK